MAKRKLDPELVTTIASYFEVQPNVAIVAKRFGISETTARKVKYGEYMSKPDYEKDAKDFALSCQRVTEDHIESIIKEEQYHVFPGTTTTVCLLVLENGFSAVGHSACADTSNFREELGRKYARENAKQQIWALEGYLLRQRLFESLH